jgi:hypothetical protein
VGGPLTAGPVLLASHRRVAHRRGPPAFTLFFNFSEATADVLDKWDSS